MHHTTLTSTTLSLLPLLLPSTLALPTTSNTTPAPSPFHLLGTLCSTTNPDPSYFTSTYATSEHVGAGLSATVGTRNISLATGFILNNTAATTSGGTGSGFLEVTGTGQGYPIQLSLQSGGLYFGDAPGEMGEGEKGGEAGGYMYVGLDLIGDGTPGFYITPSNTIASHNSTFETFAWCNVTQVPPYQHTPGLQLAWKAKGTEADLDRCAHIELSTVAV